MGAGMKPVRTLPRFKCDFCSRRSTAQSMAKHEPRCFRNPNRFCDYCENTGFTDMDMSFDIYDYHEKMPCHYCAKFNVKQLAEIEAREAKINDDRN